MVFNYNLRMKKAMLSFRLICFIKVSASLALAFVLLIFALRATTTVNTSSLFRNEKCLIFAHRGASSIAPENTLSAILLAAKQGADGVELDTQMTKDNVLILMHDRRLERTTNGRGLILNTCLSDILELDAGSYFSSNFIGEKVPTAKSALKLSKELGLLVELEIKRRDEIFSFHLAKSISLLFKQMNLYDTVFVSCFNPYTAWKIKRIDPNVPVAYAIDQNCSLSFKSSLLHWLIGYDILECEKKLVTDKFVRKMCERGIPIVTYTVNIPKELVTMIENHVTAITTDFPKKIKKKLYNKFSARLLRRH